MWSLTSIWNILSSILLLAQTLLAKFSDILFQWQLPRDIYIYIHFISNWCVSGIHVKAHPHTHIHACPDTFQTKRLLFNIHDQKGSGLGQDFYWPETRNLLQNDLPWKCSCVVRDETFLKDNFIMSLLHNGYNLLWSPLQ